MDFKWKYVFQGLLGGVFIGFLIPFIAVYFFTEEIAKTLIFQTIFLCLFIIILVSGSIIHDEITKKEKDK